MKDLIYIISVLFFIVGVVMYLVGLLLNSTDFRNTIVELWSKTEYSIQRNHIGDILVCAEIFFSAIYRRNNKLSLLKLIVITFILNGLFYFGIVLSEITAIAFPWDSEKLQFDSIEYSHMFASIFLIFSLVSTFITELLSYIVTSWMLRVAKKHNSFTPIIFDILFVLIFFVVFPFSAYLYAIHNYVKPDGITLLDILLVFFTPAAQIIVFISFLFGHFEFVNNYYLLIIPSIFSVCFPTLLVILSVYFVYNKSFLGKVSHSLLTFDSLKSRATRDAGLALCAISSGIVTILAF